MTHDDERDGVDAVRRSLAIVLPLAALWPYSASAQPASYPARTVTLVVPFSAGGATDVLARMIADRLKERWRQSVVVENRLGASGNIGAASVAKSPADGHTLLMGAIGTNAVNASLFASMPYDTEADFAPITQVARLPMILAVHPSVPATSVAELIAIAKAKPGSLNHGSAGKGASQHLASLMFETMTGARFEQVFYRGAAAMLPDLLSGRVHLSFGDLASLMPSVQAGSLRVLAVTTRARSPLLPETATIAESGVAGYDVAAWYGMFAPAKTPPAIVGRLRDEVAQILKTTEVSERLATLGAEGVGSTPEDFAAFVRSEIVRWGPVVRAAGVKAD